MPRKRSFTKSISTTLEIIIGDDGEADLAPELQPEEVSLESGVFTKSISTTLETVEAAEIS
jgi:hypothetical protein